MDRRRVLVVFVWPSRSSRPRSTTAPVALLVLVSAQSSEVQEKSKLASGPPGAAAVTVADLAWLVALVPPLSVGVHGHAVGARRRIRVAGQVLQFPVFSMRGACPRSGRRCEPSVSELRSVKLQVRSVRAT